MLNRHPTQHLTFNIEHSSFEIPSATEGVPQRAHHPEANGVWWPPRSSKPLCRRGSVGGLVRFRHASAIPPIYTDGMTVIDAATLSPGTTLSCDVCIIGGGAAGITVAHRLLMANKSKKIILLESSLVDKRQRAADEQRRIVQERET